MSPSLPAACLLLITHVLITHVLITPAAFAQTAEFRTEAKVVLVPATVLDRRGATVSGLPAAAFALTQDKASQRITSFGEQDLPASIGIVFDTSGSMREVLTSAKSVLRAFLDAANPEDEASLFTVSTRPGLSPGYTSDFNTLLSQTLFDGADGSTALVDTIYAALRQSRSAHNPRRALLIVSDGMDNHSRYTKAELMAAAVESDVQIYAVSVFNPPRNRKPIELQEERQGNFFLQELARRTGGIQIVARDSGEVAGAAARIAAAIRDQYIIGYVPDGALTDAAWHTIKVGLHVPGAAIYARSGFFAR